jgi:inorganic pyrophosphatase
VSTRLDKLAPFTDDGALQVVMETPKGSSNKYSYDPENRCLMLKKALPSGMVFPYDFGFVPSTLAEDGDPLDVLVLLDSAVPPLCRVAARPVGVIEARQKAKGEDWIRNDRLIAVAVHAHTHQHIKSLHDLAPHLLDELKAFFEQYNALEGRAFKPLRDGGPKAAAAVLAQAQKNAKRKKKRPGGDR